MRIAITLSLMLSMGLQAAFAAPPVVLEQSQQLLRVTTPSWDSLNGSLQRYQLVKHQWQPVGQPIPVVVGKNGLGWGTNFSDPNAGGAVKQEGDGKSPAGVFSIGQAFGFSSQPENKLKLPYLPLTNTSFCVDDGNSKYYNQVISDTLKINHPDWQSGEQMKQVDVYKHGAIVEYNSGHPEIGRGSCIFMHIWHSPDSGTAGCVAMGETNLTQVLAWLDPAKKPVIALLPQEEYNKLQKDWGLPQSHA